MKVRKDVFDSALSKLLRAAPLPLAGIVKKKPKKKPRKATR